MPRSVTTWPRALDIFLIGPLLSGLLMSANMYAADDTITIADFETSSTDPQSALSNSKIREFQGQTRYRIVNEGQNRVLEATSNNSASGLIFEKAYSLDDYPILSWRWKIQHTVQNGDARHKAGDDYAARIYVIFPHWFFPKTRSINYIWANKLAKDSHIKNPFTANAIMLALQSGETRAGTWVSERRNVKDDYRRLFGEEPPAVGAIAIMTDTDNTHSQAKAWFDDLRIESK